MSVDERLLLPATPALLDGWCGPMVGHDGTPLTLVRAFQHGDQWVAIVSDGAAVWTTAIHNLHLDLARAECRDRVARVVFGSPATPRMREMQKGRAFFQDFGRVGFFARAETAEDYGGTRIPALADLDPHDDTRLPDGSRLVDALALAAVAREVLR